MCKRDEDISIPSDSSKPSCFFPLPNFNSPGNFNAPRNFLSFRGERKVRGGIQVKSINYTTRRNLHDDVTTGIIVPRWGNKSRVAKTNIRMVRSKQGYTTERQEKHSIPRKFSRCFSVSCLYFSLCLSPIKNTRQMYLLYTRCNSAGLLLSLL